MRRRSIRFRITAVATLAVGVVLLVVALALTLTQRAQLTTALDASLVQRAGDIEALLASGDLPEFGPTPEDTFILIVGPDGEVIASTTTLDDDTLAGAEPGRPPRNIDLPELDEDPFRVLTTSAQTGLGVVVIHVGATYDDVSESVRILAVSLTVAIPVVVMVLGLLVWWLVGRTLQPVEQIRSQVSTISAADLGRRVPQPEGSDEIARLAETMNEMLGRLQDSVEQQQSFIADASHELRNPLTRMRATLEVEHARLPPGEAREAVASSIEEVVALQALVEDLLHLARSDAGRLSIRTETVDLDDLVLRALARLGSDGRLSVDSARIAAVQVRGDPLLLGRAVENLVDNAGRHARSWIGVSLTETDSEAVLTIEDDGPGIPAEQRERVFERFTRLDESRSRDQGGTGLGLAITRDIIERHGGTITLTSGGGGGARFEIRLLAGDA